MTLLTTRILSKRSALYSSLKVRNSSVFSSIFGSEEKKDVKAADTTLATTTRTDKKRMSTSATVETLSRGQLVDMIAAEHDLPHAKANRIVKSIFDTIAEVSDDPAPNVRIIQSVFSYQCRIYSNQISPFEHIQYNSVA